MCFKKLCSFLKTLAAGDIEKQSSLTEALRDRVRGKLKSLKVTVFIFLMIECDVTVIYFILGFSQRYFRNCSWCKVLQPD